MQSPCGVRWSHIMWLFATLALASCATQPPARDVDDSVREIRAEYLRTHPGGRFNPSIERGIVEKGMNFDDVLASWGIPDRRIRNGAGDRERWVYTCADEWSRDSVTYDFVFVGRELVEWEAQRNVSSAHYLTHPLAGDSPPPVPFPGGARGAGSLGAQKR